MNKRQHPTGNGNVFQDFGIPNAEEHLLKAQLVFKTRARKGTGRETIVLPPNDAKYLMDRALTTPTKEALTARAAELGSSALILMGFFVVSKRTAQREGGGKLQRISIHIQLGYLASGGSPSCVDALSGRWSLKRHGRRNTSKLKRLPTK